MYTKYRVIQKCYVLFQGKINITIFLYFLSMQANPQPTTRRPWKDSSTIQVLNAPSTPDTQGSPGTPCYPGTHCYLGIPGTSGDRGTPGTPFTPGTPATP